jgi:predicted esterase
MTAAVRTRMAAVAALALLVASGLAGCSTGGTGARYVEQVFTDVDATTNVVYRTAPNLAGQSITLRLDIYQPRGDTATRRPVAMWQFGGFWAAGAKEDFTPYAIDSAKRGYVGVTIQYRIEPNLQSSQINAAAANALADATAAVQWLRTNAATYRIDPNAIVTGGWSAGAINSTGLMFGPGTPLVAGGVAIAGVVQNLSPQAGRPPLIMFSSTADEIVPYKSVSDSCTRVQSAGDVCQLVTYSGLKHYPTYQGANQTNVSTTAARFLYDWVLAPKGY